MSKNYRQCILRKPTENGHKEQCSYIPERYAIKGKFLKLKEGEIWEDGWEVISAGDLFSADVVENRERDYMNTRRASDI